MFLHVLRWFLDDYDAYSDVLRLRPREEGGLEDRNPQEPALHDDAKPSVGEASRLKEPQVGPSKATLQSFAPIGSTFKATWQLLPLGVPLEVILHELFE